ncbi:MAG: hypothetical protein K6D96_03890 [Acetatifactor sp.]|nr:hypothetical protein [Acetatifactor sp.]
MDRDNLRTVYGHIAAHYGWGPQSRQTIEEMAELTQAINKHWRKFGDDTTDKGNPYYKNIVEEIADVEVCLEQLKALLNCKNQVEDVKIWKVERQLERIRG